MERLTSQVQVRLAASPLGNASGTPVFSVSRQAQADPGAQVNISAAARAMAGVSGLATGAQLQMFVQYVGAIGGNGRSFAPFSPIQNLNDRYGVPDAGQVARTEAAEAALVQQAAEGEVVAEAPAPESNPATAVAAYQATAATTAAAAGLAESA